MMEEKVITVIGGDARLEYLALELSEGGYIVRCFATVGEIIDNEKTLADALSGASAVILPIPLTPDGVYLNAQCEECHISLDEIFSQMQAKGIKYAFAGAIKNSIYDLAREKDIELRDYAQGEEMQLRNALCTAEGALFLAMEELRTTVFSTEFCIIGYGRIGRQLAKISSALGARVVCAARRAETRALIETDGYRAVRTDGKELLKALSEAGVIFNTVPALIIGDSEMNAVNSDCIMIELASAPGGIDFGSAERSGRRVICARSLPGKYSPGSAAVIIKKAICSLWEENCPELLI